MNMMNRIVCLVLVAAFASFASAQYGSPDPGLWMTDAGDPGGVINPDGSEAVPAVIYDPAVGLMWLNSAGLNQIVDTTMPTLIGGDDVGMIAMSFDSPEPTSFLLDGFVNNPNIGGGVVWTNMWFNNKTQIFGLDAGAEFLEPAVTYDLWTFAAGLTPADFGAVEVAVNFEQGQPGASMFGSVQFGHHPIGVCDFSGEIVCDVTDLNLMLSLGPIAPGIPVGINYQFDLDDDGLIGLSDLDEWLRVAAIANRLSSAYKLGDANLDGVVNVSDFNLWNTGKFTTTLLWDSGDFNGDGFADVSDFNIWNGNKFTSSDGLSAVPEPGTGFFAIASIIGLAVVRRCQGD